MTGSDALPGCEAPAMSTRHLRRPRGVPFSPDEWAAVAAAAKVAHMPATVWLRAVALKEAERLGVPSPPVVR